MTPRSIRLFLFTALAASTCILVSFCAPKVSKKQAIHRAEEFIRRNGYTDQPLDTSQYPLSFEQMELTLDMRTLVNGRKNALYSTAFCIMHEKDGWHVGFLSTIVDEATLDKESRNTDLPGRSVIVPDDGGAITMAQKDPLFSQFRKL